MRIAKSFVSITVTILHSSSMDFSVEFVKIKRKVETDIQFCAGHKLPETKKIQVWEYDGDTETTMTFKKKDKRYFRNFKRDIPGLDYHIGGKLARLLRKSKLIFISHCRKGFLQR